MDYTTMCKICNRSDSDAAAFGRIILFAERVDSHLGIEPIDNFGAEAIRRLGRSFQNTDGHILISDKMDANEAAYYLNDLRQKCQPVVNTRISGTDELDYRLLKSIVESDMIPYLNELLGQVNFERAQRPVVESPGLVNPLKAS